MGVCAEALHTPHKAMRTTPHNNVLLRCIANLLFPTIFEAPPRDALFPLQ
jgi:hypothetical protein